MSDYDKYLIELEEQANSSDGNEKFLGLWEQLHNPDSKPIEFDRFRKEAGYNAFTLSPQKWINNTITSKSGRNGGTFSHSDIAFEFASLISAEFKLYIIKVLFYCISKYFHLVRIFRIIVI